MVAITSITFCVFFLSCFSSFAGKSLFALFLEQFDDLLVKILLAAAVVSFVSHISYRLCLVVSCGVRQMEFKKCKFVSVEPKIPDLVCQCSGH